MFQNLYFTEFDQATAILSGLFRYAISHSRRYVRVADPRLPYPEPVAIQWQSSVPGTQTPVYTGMPLEKYQCASSGFPVVFQCVPIMQINTGSPLGHHWVLASASVVPVACQCTFGSSGLPVCSNYAN